MPYQKELLEKKNDLVTRAEEVLNKAKLEKRELTEAEAAELAEIRDNVRRIVKTLDIADDFDRAGEEKKKDETVTEDVTEEEKKKKIEEQETRAFDAYIRETVLNERADTAVNFTKGDNGDIIPKTIANKIIMKVVDLSPILARADRYTVKGNLDLPYYDTTNGKINVAYQEEFKPLVASGGKFKTIKLTGFLAGALSKISNSLINNAAFDVVSKVIEIMAGDIAEWINGEIFNGTEGKITGLSDLSNSLEAGSATTLTADDVVKLKGKVKRIYQKNAAFYMHPNTLEALRLLKGNNGHYLLNEDIRYDFGYSLLGKEVCPDETIPEIAAGKSVIFYGDAKNALAVKFGEQIEIKPVRERFIDEHATGIISWFEMDAKVENAQAMAVLKMKTA